MLQPKDGQAALADANGRFGFFIQGGDLTRQGLLRPTDGSLRLSNSDQKKFIKMLQIIGEGDCVCQVVNAPKSKKGPRVGASMTANAMAKGMAKVSALIAAGEEFVSQEASRRALLLKMMLAGRISISIPSMIMMTTNATMNQITSTLGQLGSNGRATALLASSFTIPTVMAFTTQKARGQDYSGAVGDAGHAATDAAVVSDSSLKAANDVSLEQAKVDSGIGFDTAGAGSPIPVPAGSSETPAPAPSPTDYSPPSTDEGTENDKKPSDDESTESSTSDTTTETAPSPSSYLIPAAAGFVAGRVSNNFWPAPQQPVYNPPAPVQPENSVQQPQSNVVIPSAAPVNSQLQNLMRSVDTLQVPPPLPAKDISLSWESVLLSKDHSEALLQVGDIGLLAWDMAGRIGSSINFPCKVLMIAGKVFIAGEDGAYVYLVKQDKAYDDALRYLKDPATSKRFALLVRDIKEGRPFFCLDSNMVKAARAINNPKLNNSGTWLAWDAMLSPEAKAAMARKACIEVGTELVSDGTEGLVGDLTEQKEVFEAARVERKQAQSMLRQTTDAAEKAQLTQAIQKTEHVMENTYKMTEAGPKLLGTIEGIFVSNEAEKGQEKSASE